MEHTHYNSTQNPMLTGTLITAAGFLPIATANSSTGEYTRSIFQVVAISLIASWIAAVMFVPLIGEKLLPDMAKAHKQSGGDGHDQDSRHQQRHPVLIAAEDDRQFARPLRQPGKPDGKGEDDDQEEQQTQHEKTLSPRKP